MNKWREYLSGAGVVLGFFLLTSIAMASTGFQKASESVSPSPSPSPSASPSEASETETVTDEPTSTVTDDGDDDSQEEPSATETVTETVTDEDQNKSPNHGHCVSYWAHQAKAQGLKGSDKGHFVSMIARDKSAVSSKVVSGGSPDATCDFQAELDAALSPAVSPTPTATVVEQSPAATTTLSKRDKRSGKKHGRSSKRRK